MGGYMKKISFEELETKNFDCSGLSRTPLIGRCLKCKSEYFYSTALTFMLNRKKNQKNRSLWNTCSKCWFLINTSESEEWRDKNRQAQLIAQNKPEQKRKNAEGVSRSWTTERKKKASDILKKKWASDEEFSEKALQNLSWTSANGDTFNKIMSKSIKTGGKRGIYNNIHYDSCLELSFILWCEENSITIKRYDLDPISYVAEDGKVRRYYPDFIISDDTVVEIKGRPEFLKNPERTNLKIEAAKKFFKRYTVLYQYDSCLSKFYRKARRIHNETYIKEDCQIQRSSE
jgi:hypothetical protein